MNLVYALILFVAAISLTLAGVTRVGTWMIERRNPPVGSFATVNDTRMHFVHVAGPSTTDLPPIVFVHGASGNLKDQMLPFRQALEGRAEMLFFDRPGHGWSARGPANEGPHGQAKTIAALMDHAGIDRAIVVGHSFGGAIAATFALDFPGRTAGLVFLAPASHPWPGGATSWYYTLTTRPVVGRLFSETLSYLGGILRIGAASECVFSPNKAPDTYVRDASIALVLRPAAFRANATDVEGLYRHALATAPLYREITAPTVVISGDSDTVVYEEIHSAGLGRDIPGAELVWVHNLGHKPDWIATDLAIAAIGKVAGRPVDLQALAKTVEARIAEDRYGVGICIDETAPYRAPELKPAE